MEERNHMHKKPYNENHTTPFSWLTWLWREARPRASYDEKPRRANIPISEKSTEICNHASQRTYHLACGGWSRSTQLKLPWPFLKVNLRILGLIGRGTTYSVQNKTTIILAGDIQRTTSCHAGRRRPILGAKLEGWRHKMLHIFHFLQSDTVLGTIIPFS